MTRRGYQITAATTTITAIPVNPFEYKVLPLHAPCCCYWNLVASSSGNGFGGYAWVPEEERIMELEELVKGGDGEGEDMPWESEARGPAS